MRKFRAEITGISNAPTYVGDNADHERGLAIEWIRANHEAIQKPAAQVIMTQVVWDSREDDPFVKILRHLNQPLPGEVVEELINVLNLNDTDAGVYLRQMHLYVKYSNEDNPELTL